MNELNTNNENQVKYAQIERDGFLKLLELYITAYFNTHNLDSTKILANITSCFRHTFPIKGEFNIIKKSFDEDTQNYLNIKNFMAYINSLEIVEGSFIINPTVTFEFKKYLKNYPTYKDVVAKILLEDLNYMLKIIANYATSVNNGIANLIMHFYTGSKTIDISFSPYFSTSNFHLFSQNLDSIAKEDPDMYNTLKECNLFMNFENISFIILKLIQLPEPVEFAIKFLNSK